MNCKQPLDLVKRDFSASRLNPAVGGRLHFTRYGCTCTTFVINVHSRYIVGWRVMRSMETTLVFDAPDGLMHHSDRGNQYLSLRYSARLEEAGVKASVGTVGDTYDNVLAESIIGLYKTEVIARQGWRGAGDVELSTLEWADWFNQRRLPSSISYNPASRIWNGLLSPRGRVRQSCLIQSIRPPICGAVHSAC